MAKCGVQAGLEPLCRALCLSAAQLAESLNSLYKKHEPEDGAVLPPALAASFVAEVRACGRLAPLSLDNHAVWGCTLGVGLKRRGGAA